MSSREQIGKPICNFNPGTKKWIKRMYSKLRRKREKKLLEDAPKKNDYKGYVD